MKKLSLYAYLMLLTMSTLMMTSCGDDDSSDPEPEPELNIIEWAEANGDFTLLLAAAEKAGLTATLSDPTSQFTIFGPKDETFQPFLDLAFGDGTGAAGTGTLDNVDAATAGALLTGHALLGLRTSDGITTGYTSSLGRLEMDPDGNFTASMYINADGGVAVNGGVAATGGATVTEADITTTNGIIHVVDNVIVPAKVPTFVAVDPELSMTLEAISRDDLGIDVAGTAGGDDLLTVFAPTNAAWEAYLPTTSYSTIAEIPGSELLVILLKHIHSGTNNRSAQIVDGTVTSISNLASGNLTFGTANGVTVNAGGDNTATVTKADIQAHNGVIHKIDTVLD